MRRKGKFVNTGNEDDLGKDKRYDRSSQGYGFKGFHENPGSNGFKVKNSNNFWISKQVIVKKGLTIMKFERAKIV